MLMCTNDCGNNVDEKSICLWGSIPRWLDEITLEEGIVGLPSLSKSLTTDEKWMVNNI